MTVYTINGTEIFVETSGDPAAPPVLLMHSIGTSSFIWQDVAERLSPRFRVICPDFRGHGGSAVTTGDYSVKMLADDMAALCRAIGIRPAHIGGLSLGGLVAQQLALDDPGLISSLILCDTGLSIPPDTLWRDRAVTVREQGVAALGDASFYRWVSPAFGETPNGQRLRAIFEDTSSEGYAGAAIAIAEADFSAVAGAISAPTLVLAGSDDVATPPSLAQALAERIAGARLHIVQDARHIPSLERAAETASVIEDFLAGLVED